MVRHGFSRPLGTITEARLTMTKKPSAKATDYAERLCENTRRYSERLEQAAWALESALSALNKDDAGYRRSNNANRDGGESYTPGELEAAVLDVEKAYPWLKPGEALT